MRLTRKQREQHRRSRAQVLYQLGTLAERTPEQIARDAVRETARMKAQREKDS